MRSTLRLVRIIGVAGIIAIWGGVTLASSPPQGECDDIIARAWVDSTSGNDLPWTGSPPSSPQINDIAHPFQTIQAAIDAVQNQLILTWNGSTEPAPWQGIVYVTPGVYGPDAPGPARDVLPIVMRDRVHLKGLHGRACVIRDSGTNSSNPAVIQEFWPLARVLASGRRRQPVRWAGEGHARSRHVQQRR